MLGHKHWGEIESAPLQEEVKPIDNVALEEMVKKLSVGGPMKLHQPYSSEDGSVVQVAQECSKMEDNVLHSIRLMEKIRNFYGCQGNSSTSSNFDVSTDATAEETPMETEEVDCKNRVKQNLIDLGYGSFAQSHPTPPPELRPYVARQILQKSVAALIAHAGYNTASLSSLQTVTDITKSFIERITKLLKIAVDQEAESGPHGFPDAVEWAFFEAGLGSITSLHHYYQDNVLKQRSHLEKMVADLPSLPPSPSLQTSFDEPVRINLNEEVQNDTDDDDIPEIHFPALGNGETSEEMQSTLEPGFQMLHSLEEDLG